MTHYPELPMGTAVHASDGVTAAWTSDELKKYADDTYALRQSIDREARQIILDEHKKILAESQSWYDQYYPTR